MIHRTDLQTTQRNINVQKQANIVTQTLSFTHAQVCYLFSDISGPAAFQSVCACDLSCFIMLTLRVCVEVVLLLSPLCMIVSDRMLTPFMSSHVIGRLTQFHTIFPEYQNTSVENLMHP